MRRRTSSARKPSACKRSRPRRTRRSGEEYQRYRSREDEDYSRSGERVKIGDEVTVWESELIDGDVVSIGDNVQVYGRVEGDVVAIGGSVYLHDGAEVDGDVVAVGGRIRELGESQVTGEKVSVGLGIPFDAAEFNLFKTSGTWEFAFDLAWILVGLLFAMLFYAIAGKRLDVVSRRVDEEPGQSFLIGLLAAFGTPIAFLISTILLVLTVIGILLVPVLVILLFFMVCGGYFAVALAVGRRLTAARKSDLPSSRGPFFHLFIGFVALYALDFLSGVFGMSGSFMQPFAMLTGVLGCFVTTFASILGFGALITSRFGTSIGGPTGPTFAPSGPGEMPPPPPGAVPPPPPPPPPTSVEMAEKMDEKSAADPVPPGDRKEEPPAGSITSASASLVSDLPDEPSAPPDEEEDPEKRDA